METKHVTYKQKILDGGVELVYTSEVEVGYPIVLHFIADGELSNVLINGFPYPNLAYPKAVIIAIPTSGRLPGSYFCNITYEVDGITRNATVDVIVENR